MLRLGLIWCLVVGAFCFDVDVDLSARASIRTSSTCFAVDEGVEGIFLSTWAAYTHDYECITDRPDCNVHKLEDIGVIDATGVMINREKKHYTFRELCRDFDKPYVTYYTLLNVRNKTDFINVTKNGAEKMITHEKKIPITHQGNEFQTTAVNIQGKAIIIDSLVVYAHKPTATNRRGKGNMGSYKVEFGQDETSAYACHFPMTSNFTIGHIIGLTLGGPDTLSNCALERSKINSLKSEHIERKYLNPKTYGYRVTEIKLTPEGTPYPSKFVHTVSTDEEVCFFNFDQDAEEHKMMTKTCTVTGITKYNFAFAISDWVKDITRTCITKIGSWIHKHCPEKVGDMWDYIAHHVQYAIYVAVDYAGEAAGWVYHATHNVVQRFLEDSRNKNSHIVSKITHANPALTHDMQNAIRLGVGRFLEGNDQIIIFTIENLDNVEAFKGTLMNVLEQEVGEVVSVGPSNILPDMKFGAKTIIFKDVIGEGNIPGTMQFFKSNEENTALLGITFMVRRACKQQVNCPYGTCPKGSCPKYFSQYGTEFGKCKESKNCMVIPVTMNGDQFPIQDDEQVIGCSGDNCGKTTDGMEGDHQAPEVQEYEKAPVDQEYSAKTNAKNTGSLNY